MCADCIAPPTSNPGYTNEGAFAIEFGGRQRESTIIEANFTKQTKSIDLARWKIYCTSDRFPKSKPILRMCPTCFAGKPLFLR